MLNERREACVRLTSRKVQSFLFRRNLNAHWYRKDWQFWSLTSHCRGNSGGTLDALTVESETYNELVRHLDGADTGRIADTRSTVD
jgi:hypothetical protein